VKLELVCVRCGDHFFREKSKENFRIKRGCSGPYCSTSCAARLDDPRAHKEPDPVPGARWLRLTFGKFALVDEDLFAELNRRQWYWMKGGGTSVGHAGSDNGRSFVLLHRVILGVSARVFVDHRNNNGLDCRRENLRAASRQGNGANRGKFVGRKGRTFTSRYKGVIDRSRHLSSSADPWLARIRVDGRLIHLGRYATEHEAALAYDRAALQHFGEFARLNFSAQDGAL